MLVYQLWFWGFYCFSRQEVKKLQTQCYIVCSAILRKAVNICGCNCSVIIFKKICFSPQTASVTHRRSLWIMQIVPDLDPHLLGSHWFWLVLKYANDSNFFSHFQAILQVDLTWPLTSFFDLWLNEHVKVPTSYNKPCLVPIKLQLFKWGVFYIILNPSYDLTSDDLWPWYMAFDHMNIQRVPYSINKPSLIPNFNFSKAATFTFSPHLTTWPKMTIDIDATLDLISKWEFSCCIHDASFGWNPSMWKVEPNVTLFSQETSTNNSRQSNPYVSFLLRQATQKQNEKSWKFVWLKYGRCNKGITSKTWVFLKYLEDFVDLLRTYFIGPNCIIHTHGLV